MQDAADLLLANANVAVYVNLHTCVLHGLHAHKSLSKNQTHLAREPVGRMLDAAGGMLDAATHWTCTTLSTSGYLHPLTFLLATVTWPILSL